MFGLLVSYDLNNIGRTLSRLVRCHSKTCCREPRNASEARVEACQLNKRELRAYVVEWVYWSTFWCLIPTLLALSYWDWRA